MEALEFISKWEIFIEEISCVIKPELLPIIDKLKDIDPHDFVKPETFFLNDSHARGFVWSLFLKKAKKDASYK